MTVFGDMACYKLRASPIARRSRETYRHEVDRWVIHVGAYDQIDLNALALSTSPTCFGLGRVAVAELERRRAMDPESNWGDDWTTNDNEPPRVERWSNKIHSEEQLSEQDQYDANARVNMILMQFGCTDSGLEVCTSSIFLLTERPGLARAELARRAQMEAEA